MQMICICVILTAVEEGHIMGTNFRVFLFLCIGLLVVTFAGCNQKVDISGDKLTVAVSIVPQETFVKAVAGDLVNVVTMIPPGKSPENYAPTPQEIELFSKSSIYFTIGVPTETQNILPKAKDINKNLKVISLADEVKKIYPEREFSPGNRDPHIWLSPKRVKIMVEVIARELSAIDSKNKVVYEKNAKEYIQKLDRLDKYIKASLSKLKNKTFIIYHPAFGYFADDYGLTMVSLEDEGKEATAKDLQNMVDRAKREKIKVIFYQAEIDSKQARVFAAEIGGKAIQVEPLAPDYIENLQRTTETFVNVLK